MKQNGQAVWIATDPKTGDKFVALFNLKEKENTVKFNLELESLRGEYKVRDLWEKKEIGTVSKELIALIPSHGAKIFRLSSISIKK